MNQRQQESLHTSHMSECCYYLPYVYMYFMSFMLTCKVHICIVRRSKNIKSSIIGIILLGYIISLQFCLVMK